MPEAKGKIRRRHQEAIDAFLQWKEEHPKAKLARQVKMFDAFVDGATLDQMLKRKNVKHPHTV